MPGRAASELDPASLSVIYTSAFAENAWQDAVEFIVDRLDAFLVVLSLRVSRDGVPTIGVQSFRDQGRTLWQRYWESHAFSGTFDYDRMEAGQIYPLSESALDDEAVQRINTELLEPLGAGETYCLPIGKPGHASAYLIWIKRRGETISADERAWCTAAFPHLSRAIAAYQRLRQAELAARLAGSALDHLAIGVAALDSSDRILFANREAERLIAQSDDLGIHGDRLVALRPDLLHQLAAARTAPQATRVRGKDEQGIGVLITPAGGRDEMGPDSRPERAIYFHESGSPTRVPERIVADLLGLPRNEARLAALLARGLTLREVAAELGVTENTARTYSKLVYSKLGISRQADLVRIVLRSVAMLVDET